MRPDHSWLLFVLLILRLYGLNCVLKLIPEGFALARHHHVSFYFLKGAISFPLSLALICIVIDFSALVVVDVLLVFIPLFGVGFIPSNSTDVVNN